VGTADGRDGFLLDGLLEGLLDTGVEIGSTGVRTGVFLVGALVVAAVGFLDDEGVAATYGLSPQ
jgi:hypothetical protein